MKFIPPTTPRERRACGACSNCHPGRQFGGDERCTRPTCTCHQGDTLSDPVPRKQLVALSERDGFVCVWTATQGDRLIPQHRQGGMGGRPDKHRTENLLWLDSILNGLIEADAALAEIAKAYGIKVPIWVKDVAAVPVFFAHEHRWFILEGNDRREITAVDALDRMHTLYGDEYFQWKARADRTPHAAIYAMRTR